MKDATRELAVVMFSDLVGYSALTQQNEDLALELLELHQNIMASVIKDHGGVIIKTIGDAFLVKFTSAINAVNCALKMQDTQESTNEGQPFERKIQMRIGIHLGEIINHKNDIYGDGVNVASRIEQVAEPGGICISKVVYDQVHKSFKKRLVPAGKKHLKNIEQPVELFNIEPGILTNTKIIDITRLQERSEITMANIANDSSKTTPKNKNIILIVSITTILLALIIGGIATQTLLQKKRSVKLERISKYRGKPLYSKIDSMDLSQEAKLKFKKFYEIINETPFPGQLKEKLFHEIDSDLLKYEYQKEDSDTKKSLALLEEKLKISVSIAKAVDTYLKKNPSRHIPQNRFELIRKCQILLDQGNLAEAKEASKELEQVLTSDTQN